MRAILALFITLLTGMMHAQDVNLVWAKGISGPESYSIAVDATGNVYT